MDLLKKLCSIHAPSGDESLLTKFILNYIDKNKNTWKVKPRIYYGDDFQDTIILVFGKPTTAIFAHIDSIGFTVGYNNEIVKIGGPRTKSEYILVGKDSKGVIKTKLKVKRNNPKLSVDYNRKIDRGTTLTFKPNFRDAKNYIQSPYIDNRLGVFVALKTAESLKNGIICFSTYEEHGGGSVGFLAQFIYSKFKVKQALISDITWVTNGIKYNKGVAISMRDSGIPRKSYIDKIINLAKKSGIPFQLEVESAGGSDGNQLQHSPFPIDWCFIGAPEKNVHTPDEKVHKNDINSMIQLYKFLMEKL